MFICNQGCCINRFKELRQPATGLDRMFGVGPDPKLFTIVGEQCNGAGLFLLQLAQVIYRCINEPNGMMYRSGSLPGKTIERGHHHLRVK